MKFHSRVRITVPALLGTATVFCAFFPTSRVTPIANAASPLYLTSNLSFQATGITKNFNPFSPNQNDFTNGAVYEPLMIITPVNGGKTYKWLATDYKYSNGNKTLIVTLRSGVRWSDGKPFTAKDVAFTFNYGKKYSAADQNGLWAGKYLSSVNAQGANTVAFNYTKVNSTLLPNILSTNIKILPEHVWSKVTDPEKYSDNNLVGTGPFAHLTKFSPQEVIYGKNPYYWQKLSYDGLKVINYLDNSGATTALVRGDLDWTGHFVPDTQGTYVSKDPAHFHYYYSNTNPLGLWFNDQKYPYNLAAFRKALSYAVNRPKIYRIAENGYELPADATGIKVAYPTWYDRSIDKQSTDLTTYNLDKARSALMAAGFKYSGGHLVDPKGNKISMTLSCPAPWSDWVLTLQIIAQDFKKIGIDASFKGLDQAVWFTKSQAGQLDGHIHWTNFGVTPYETYYSYLSKESFTPIGTDASLNGQANWARYSGSDEASTLFAQFRSTTDLQKQKRIVDQLQRIQIRDLPYIPIMNSADWYTYSTLHFTGWPTKENFYVRGSANDYPDRLVVMTRITPVSSSR